MAAIPRTPTRTLRNRTVSEPATPKQTKARKQPHPAAIQDTLAVPPLTTTTAEVYENPDAVLVLPQSPTPVPTSATSENRGRLCLQLAELQEQLTTVTHNYSLLQDEFNIQADMLSRVEADLQAERERVTNIQIELTRVQKTADTEVAKAKAAADAEIADIREAADAEIARITAEQNELRQPHEVNLERQLLSLQRQITELSQKLVSPSNASLSQFNTHNSHLTPHTTLSREVPRNTNVVSEAFCRSHEVTLNRDRLDTNVNQCQERSLEATLGYTPKPASFDGSTPLREFMTQFNLLARFHKWDNFSKLVALVTSLKGKARSVLDDDEIDNLDFEALKSRLELGFGDKQLSPTYYSQFHNRHQRPGEDIQTLAIDLERLAKLAYPEESYKQRDKIACHQFVDALFDFKIKEMLQLERIESLKIAVARALEIQTIHDSIRRSQNSGRQPTNNQSNWRSRPSQTENRHPNQGQPRVSRENVTCYNCRQKGHYRSECPTLTHRQGN